MKYDVLVNFTDGADKTAPIGGNVYYVGGVYPRSGHTPTPERIKTLQGVQNAFKKPCIGMVDRSPSPPAPKETPQGGKK